MTDIEIGWIAGLLEGEGCFDIQGRSSPRISLNMTDEDVILRFASLVKHHLPVIGKRGKYSNHKTRFAITIGGSRALKLMYIIRPYMSERRKIKIDEIISIVIRHRPGILNEAA